MTLKFTATDVYQILKQADIPTKNIGNIYCMARFLKTREYYRCIKSTDDNIKKFIIDIATEEYKNQIPINQMVPDEYIHNSIPYREAEYLTMSLKQLTSELNELINRRFTRNCYDKFEYLTFIELCKNELEKRIAITEQ